jgi:hypothetical protein
LTLRCSSGDDDDGDGAAAAVDVQGRAVHPRVFVAGEVHGGGRYGIRPDPP